MTAARRYMQIMFGISGEHLLVLAIVLLIFGPRRLPEMGHTLGKAIRNFKDSMAGIEEATFRRVEEQKGDQKASAPGGATPVGASVASANLGAQPASQSQPNS